MNSLHSPQPPPVLSRQKTRGNMVPGMFRLAFFGKAIELAPARMLQNGVPGLQVVAFPLHRNAETSRHQNDQLIKSLDRGSESATGKIDRLPKEIASQFPAGFAPV